MIQNTNINLSLIKPSLPTSFKGSDSPLKKPCFDYLLAFDLDGTFLHCNKNDIVKFVELSKNQNCKLIFVSGRLANELDSIKAEFKQKGITIPTPDYFVSNNGQFIFENFNGKLLPSEEWNNLIASTGFNRDKIKSFMEGFIQNNTIESKPALLQFNHRPSEFNIEYLIDSKMENIEAKLKNHFKNSDIKCKFIFDYVTPEDVNKGLSKLPSKVKDIIKPMLDKDGGIYALHITAVNKADSVEFIRNKLKIDKNHVITAGNGGNDFSMAAQGYWFILVSNAQNILKDLIQSISQNKVIKATKAGLSGINEAIEKIFNK
ncbi:MAG: HAD family hydrolase [Cyanobacteriota bacterium]